MNPKPRNADVSPEAPNPKSQILKPIDQSPRRPESLNPIDKPSFSIPKVLSALRLMDKILHDPKDPKLWELWYIPYNG